MDSTLPKNPAQTPLHDWHAAHGGRMVDFAGWSMPVQYSSIVDEHVATRTQAGLFDISHMGRLRFDGPAARDFLEHLLTRRVADMRPGQIRYSLVTNDQGAVLDDVLLYALADAAGGEYWVLVVNAGNREKIVRWLQPRVAQVKNVAMTDVTSPWAMIAVQGPRAIELLQPLVDVPLAEMKYYTGVECRIAYRSPYAPREETHLAADRGPYAPREETHLATDRSPHAPREETQLATDRNPHAPCEETHLATDRSPYAPREETHLAERDVYGGGIVSRTGYTGEDGCELILGNNAVEGVWQRLVDAGAKPCGLGARDTLRLEAGMPLYGHELSEEIRLASCGLDFAIHLKDRSFPGCDALARDRAAGASTTRVGIVLEGKRVPREHFAVVLGDGTKIGETSSGTFSPTLQQPIAMAFVDVQHAASGTAVGIDIRGRVEPGKIVDLPFYRRTK